MSYQPAGCENVSSEIHVPGRGPQSSGWTYTDSNGDEFSVDFGDTSPKDALDNIHKERIARSKGKQLPE